MHSITKTNLLSLSLFLIVSYSVQAQETTIEHVKAIPVEGEQATEARNTFVDYHAYILDTDDFRFRKEIKKVKKEADFLEYASPENSIRISKFDYMRLVRRAVNQSDSTDEFITMMAQQFPDTENRFTETLDLETLYSSTRSNTFYGRFDGLPRIW